MAFVIVNSSGPIAMATRAVACVVALAAVLDGLDASNGTAPAANATQKNATQHTATPSKGPPAPRKDDPLAHVASLRFLHIPKTGGTTVETLGKELGLHWGMYDDRFRSKSAEHRCSAWHVPQRPAKKGGAHDRTFCVLRHPAERLVSQFHHEASEAAYCDGDRFDAWVDRALDQARRDKNHRDCHFVQQTEYAQFCDLFARLPSLEADLKTLLGCYGDGREKLANHSVGHVPGGRVQQEKRGHEPRPAVDACARNLARRLGNSSLFNKLYGEDAKLFRDAPPPSCEPQSVRKFKKWPPPPPKPPPPPPCELVDGTPRNATRKSLKDYTHKIRTVALEAGGGNVTCADRPAAGSKHKARLVTQHNTKAALRAKAAARAKQPAGGVGARTVARKRAAKKQRTTKTVPLPAKPRAAPVRTARKRPPRKRPAATSLAARRRDPERGAT